MAELPDDVYAQVTDLSENGNLACHQGEPTLGRKLFEQALAILPAPKSDWDAYTWLWAAIGDCYFEEKNWEGALASMQNAANGPDGMGNPFIHLRLGQSFFELGDETKALDELVRAYMSEGKDIFLGSDPQYFDFLQERVEI